MKTFTCTVTTSNDKEITAYFEDGKVFLDGAGKKVQVIFSHKFNKTCTIIASGKEVSIGLKIGATFLEKMICATEKEGRELVMFESEKEIDASIGKNGIGSIFQVVDAGVRVTCAYRYA